MGVLEERGEGGEEGVGGGEGVAEGAAVDVAGGRRGGLVLWGIKTGEEEAMGRGREGEKEGVGTRASRMGRAGCGWVCGCRGC